MGKKPAKLAKLEEFVDVVKKLVNGEQVEYGECSEPVQFSWADNYELPVWIAAYGPKALSTAGRVGDGLIIQIAEPQIVKWLTEQAINAGKDIGKDMSNYKVMVAAPAYTGPTNKNLEKVKWFPAMVGNHVADIVEKYGKDTDEVPKSLTAYIEKRRGYDYSKHGQSDNPYLDFITDDVVESFCVLGEPEAHVEKLKVLENNGATQFNIYLDNGDEEKIIADYGEKIIPHF
jgi:probable F420-dependent oxidoreductase